MSLNQNITQKYAKKNVRFSAMVFFNDKTYYDFSSEILEFEMRYALNTFPFGNFLWNDVEGNLYNRFILSGGEPLRVAISTSNTNEGKIEQHVEELVIYAINMEDINVPGEASKGRIRVFFCSSSSLKNAKTLVRRGWRGTKQISSIVEDLCVDHLNISKKELDIRPTLNTMDNFIAPNKRPKEIIDYLKKQSLFNGKDDFYVFFKNRSGYHFRPMAEYVLATPKTAFNRSMGTSKQIISAVEITSESTKKGFDLMEGLLNETFGKTFVSFDRKTKKLTSQTCKMDSDYLNRVAKLGKYNYYNKSFLEDIEQSAYVVESKPHLTGHLNYPIYSNLFQNIMIEVTLPGNLIVDVGDIVSITHLASQLERNSSWSGLWMILGMNVTYSTVSETNQLAEYNFETSYTLVKLGYNIIHNDCEGSSSVIKSKRNINKVD